MNISAALLTRDELLSRLDVLGFYGEHVRDFKPNGEAHVRGWCPFHAGHTPALSVNKQTGLFNCHGEGCGAAGSAIDFLVRLRGCSVAEAFEELRKRVNGSAPKPKLTVAPKPPIHLDAIPETKRVRADKEDKFGTVYTKAATYGYTLSDGAAKAVKVRYERDGDKVFSAYTVDPAGGFWVGLDCKMFDLYTPNGLPPVAERSSRIAVLSEGEKATDRLARYLAERPDEAGLFVAVGSHGCGAFQADGARLAKQITGFREVVAVVDRDEHGALWAESLRRHGEARFAVRFVQSAVETESADLHDHLEAGHALAELVPYAEAPKIEAPRSDPAGPTGTLAEVVETFRRWQYLPDVRGLYATLGSYAANQSDGDPVWLLIVGPPGSGKTEIVQTLAGLPDVHPASTLTAASLLSGTPKKEKAKDAKGGLLREIGDFGIMLCKDFTSVLSMHRDGRAEVLAALREIFDGSWTRHIGTDGGRSLSWSGRVGFVGGVTPTIDRHGAVMASMGERFLLFRMPTVDRHELTRRALGHTKGAAKMRAELAEAVAGLFAGLDFEAETPALTEAETEDLIGLADFVTTARSPVERDGYKREIELIPGAEAPTRLAITLARLLGGLRTVGVNDGEAWSTVRKCALDCVPAGRLAVLKAVDDGATWTAKEVAEVVGYPTTTTRRILEDLAAYGLVTRTSEGVGYSDEWRKSGAFSLGGGVPEKSEGVYTP